VDHHISNAVTVLVENDLLMGAMLEMVDGEFTSANTVDVLRTLVCAADQLVLCLHLCAAFTASPDGCVALQMARECEAPVSIALCWLQTTLRPASSGVRLRCKGWLWRLVAS